MFKGNFSYLFLEKKWGGKFRQLLKCCDSITAPTLTFSERNKKLLGKKNDFILSLWEQLEELVYQNCKKNTLNFDEYEKKFGVDLLRKNLSIDGIIKCINELNKKDCEIKDCEIKDCEIKNG